jgi:murein DD-endopeptidase MepM/ murein hydrolase activator NlpD
VTQYKKAEKAVADRFGKRLRVLWNSILAFFKYVIQKGRQRFTVMLIPHSEKKIFNFQISFFTLIFVTSFLVIVFVGFFVLATHFTSTNEEITKVSSELETNNTTLQSLRDEISGFRTVGRKFQAEMTNILKAINSEASRATGTGGPLPTIATSAPDENGSEALRELSELESMTTLMDNSIVPLSEISKALTTFKGLLAETPTLWPLKGTHGIITTRYGWTIHPFTNKGYMHTGIDLSWAVGTPIVATANGDVVQVGYSGDYGINVLLKHKYGFNTRYAHMSRTTVVKNQKVTQGDVIGYLGSTGLSTGPHLHYEVRLGLNYIDPTNFMAIESDISAVNLSGGRDQ